MRVLVTGGTGLLGWWVARELVGRGAEVFATYHSHTPPPGLLEGVSWKRLELLEPESIRKVIEEAKPEVVVHAAAYTDVDGCEDDRDRALRVNYLATAHIARECARLGCGVIYVSTDYVFDGTRGGYSEYEPPSPVNYYGLSKLLGEAAARGGLGEEALVVRVSGLYGYSPLGKRNFGTHVLEALLRGRRVRAFADQRLSPTYVPFLAERLSRLALQEHKGLGPGILHVAGEAMSRYEFAVLVARELRVGEDRVEAVSLGDLPLRAQRPRDSSLSTHLAAELGLALPPQVEGVRHFIDYYRSVVRGMGGVG